MGCRRAERLALFALVALAACGDNTTSVLLELDGPATITHLDATVTLGTGRSVTRGVDITRLPARLVVQLPDVAQTVTIELAAVTDAGVIRTTRVITAAPHQQLRVPVLFDGAPSDDGGGDRSDGGVDAGGGPPVPRLVRNAFYTDYSGSTYTSGLGMAKTKFEIATDGIVNGDLVLFVGSIDNGSNTLWPNPIAPGFTQLVQQFYGNDGQTFVVAYKIADNEPATYSGTYGSGLGSGSSTISLIAVSGVNRAAPINAWISTYDPGPGMTPVVGTSNGVTTTVPNTTVLYMMGADWLGQVGMNTFAPPTGYTPIAEIGDRGSQQWDWTSQQIDSIVKPTAGPTGMITGSMTGTYTATAWTVIVALAPAP